MKKMLGKMMRQMEKMKSKKCKPDKEFIRRKVNLIAMEKKKLIGNIIKEHPAILYLNHTRCCHKNSQNN